MAIKTLYCGAFRFPSGDAAAARVYSVAQLFTARGLKVSFAGWESPQDKSEHYVFQGHDCYPMSEFREQPLGPLRRLIGFLFRGHRTLRWLYRSEPHQVVIAYNPPVFFSIGLFLLQKTQGFSLILDSTEWYECEHLPGGKFGVASIENWVRMNWIYPRFDNVICISRFLANHYKGRNTVQIPPLVTTEEISLSPRKTDSEIRFLYAGNAGKKDLLTPFITVLPRVGARLGRQVSLDVAGVTWDELVRQIRCEGSDPAVFTRLVRCHGRLPKERVRELYEKADFSILFREDKRYAYAGFPTKAVESWSMGCPIILNQVGDIGDIAMHMEDAVIVRPDQMEEDLVNSLGALLVSDRLSLMRRNCLRKAQDIFTGPAYSKVFEEFLVKAGIQHRSNAESNQ